MAFTLRLDDARTEVIHLAAVDGKTGSNSRHAPARINAILNRKYRELLSRAGQLGIDHGRLSSTGTLGAPVSGEDYISLSIPSGAAEAIGIDVKYNGDWQKLDPLSWEQRRDVDSLTPPHGVGFWALLTGPSVSGSTLTQGTLAIFPTRLASTSYTLHQVKQWTAITADADVFLLHDGWDEWLLNATVMACAARDSNKRTNYDTARDAWITADNLLEAQAARLYRAGSIDPTPYLGIRL